MTDFRSVVSDGHEATCQSLRISTGKDFLSRGVGQVHPARLLIEGQKVVGSVLGGHAEIPLRSASQIRM